MKLFNYIIINTIILGTLTGIGYSIYFLYDNVYLASLFVLIFFYVSSWIFSLIIFWQKRSYQSKIFWTLTILLFPLVGYIYFLFFGRKYSKMKSLRQYHQKKNFSFENLQNKLPMKNKLVKNLFNKQSQLSCRGIYQGNFQIFSNGDLAFESLFADLKKAQKFIHLHYYIIKYGEIFEEFKAILIERASKGVEIKFIIDDFGRWALPLRELQELKNHGIKIILFGKLYFPFFGSESCYRTHRKIAIIDGKIVHTGGMNIADEYSNLNKKYGLWLDNHAKITGKATRSYSLLFLEDWKFATNKELDYKKYLLELNGGNSFSVLVEDSPEIHFPLLRNSLIMWIKNASKTISLSTPYMIPTKEIVNALKTAALSGVEIKIFLPGRADKKPIYFATEYWINELIQFDIKFYKTKDIFLHSKMAIFDEEYAYFGTSNLDIRSFYSQFEVLNLLSGPVVKDIQNVFNYYQNISIKIEKTDLQTKAFKRKLMMLYVSIFSILM